MMDNMSCNHLWDLTGEREPVFGLVLLWVCRHCGERALMPDSGEYGEVPWYERMERLNDEEAVKK